MKFAKKYLPQCGLIRNFRSTVFTSEGDGNLFGTTNYQLPNPHIDLPLTLKITAVLLREC